MNALIIVTAALTGPLPCETASVSPQAINEAALAAFSGPSSALAMGAGDALGYELYSVDILARNDSMDMMVVAAE